MLFRSYGDDKVQEFLTQWNRICSSLDMEVSDNDKRDLLYDKVKDSRKFAYDLAHYSRQKGKYFSSKVPQPDHTLEFLMDMLQMSIINERDERIKEERKRSVYPKGHPARKGDRKAAPAAPAVTTAPNTPKKEKKSKHDRSKSAPKNSRTKAQKGNPGQGNQGNKQDKKGRKSSRGRSDRKSTRLNSIHSQQSRMPSSA